MRFRCWTPLGEQPLSPAGWPRSPVHSARSNPLRGFSNPTSASRLAIWRSGLAAHDRRYRRTRAGAGCAGADRGRLPADRPQHVATAASLVSLPAVECRVSVFVDSVEDAAAAVAAGATDLLLRDWDTESLGALREALAPVRLTERAALPPDVAVDDLRDRLDAELFKAIPRPGRRLRLRPTPLRVGSRQGHAGPGPGERFSAEWLDQSWVTASDDGNLDDVGRPRRHSAPFARRDRPTRDEVERLFRSRGARSMPSPTSPMSCGSAPTGTSSPTWSTATSTTPTSATSAAASVPSPRASLAEPAG